MRIDAIGVSLRRRGMHEAADLGVRLVASHARSVWGATAPVFLAVLGLALALHEATAGLSLLAVWWLKPWLDRSVLFVLSRALFGEATRWRDLVAAAGPVWWQDLPATLTLRRLSPWRAYVAPARQLEGQRGAARRRRVVQLLNRQRGTAMAVQAVFAHVELALFIGLATLPAWLLPAPDASSANLFRMLLGFDPVTGTVAAAAYLVAVWVVEPFFVGAGFAMYLNRRVELEAWDVEQELRVAFASA